MKLIIKIAILAIAAKMFVATPRGSSKELDRVGDMTVRQVAHDVVHKLAQIEAKITKLLS